MVIVCDRSMLSRSFSKISERCDVLNALRGGTQRRRKRSARVMALRRPKSAALDRCVRDVVAHGLQQVGMLPRRRDGVLLEATQARFAYPCVVNLLAFSHLPLLPGLRVP